jgi:Fur family peroxide stress response transcriptional regulator
MAFFLNKEQVREQVKQRLKDNGYRVTSQRLAIVELLFDLEHPTADEIYQSLTSEFSNMSLATVYNTLHSLENIGTVRGFSCGEKCFRYELYQENHHHLICNECSKIVDIFLETCIDTAKVAEQTGFKNVTESVEFRGICAECADKLSAPAE